MNTTRIPDTSILSVTSTGSSYRSTDERITALRFTECAAHGATAYHPDPATSTYIGDRNILEGTCMLVTRDGYLQVVFDTRRVEPAP